MKKIIEKLLTEAKNACRTFQMVDTDTKIQALHAIAQKLIDQQDRILQANQKDIAQAKENGISAAMMDRLLLSPQRIQEMSEGVRMVAHLDDPIGQVIREMDCPNGLRIKQIRIPIGTVGVVYEARPNVTVDIAAICIKTNNVCILKGGKEAYYSNMALAQVMQEAIADILPVSPIYMIDAIDHEVVTELITDRAHVDVVIPRGGQGLIQYVVQNAKVPVIETGAGLCHLYVDKEADIDMALQIAQNAKLQRPSVCNAIETILVHTDVAKEFLTRLAPMFAKVQVFGDARSLQYIPGEMAT